MKRYSSRAFQVLVTGLKQFSVVLYYATVWVTNLLLLTSAGITFWGIIARFAFNSSLPWAEEAGAYLLVALTFLGIAIGLHEQSHPAVDVIIERLPRPVQTGRTVLVSFIAAAVGYVLVVHGIEFMEMIGNQSAVSFAMPVRYAYLALPVAGALYIVFGATNAVLALSGGAKREFEQEVRREGG